jgi:hypothetical protein
MGNIVRVLGVSQTLYSSSLAHFAVTKPTCTYRSRPWIVWFTTFGFRWHILEDGICLVELFGGISSSLVVVLQFGIRVCRYYYVEKDLQAW